MMQTILVIMVLILLLVGLASIAAIFHPIQTIEFLRTRSRAAVSLLVSWVLLAVIGAVDQARIRAELEEARIESLREIWVPQPYEVIEASVADFPRIHESLGIPREVAAARGLTRTRMIVYVVSADAVTRESRIATIMEAALGEHRRSRSQTIVVNLKMSRDLDGFRLAHILYTPDGCGWTGEDCTGDLWTEAEASDRSASGSAIAIREAWEENKARFLRGPGDLDDQESRHRLYLSEQLGVTPDDVEEALNETSGASFFARSDVDLPDFLKDYGRP